MKKEKKLRGVQLNPDEAKELKAIVFDLREKALKQTLFGIIQFLTVKMNVPSEVFKEILDDARKYDCVKRRA